MDWDALVQRLWRVIESRGFETFSARLESALPDRSCEALTRAVRCLHASGHSDLAQSLLSEFLSHHAYSSEIKRRLQMLLLFETRYTPEERGAPLDIESVMAEVRDLLDSNCFDKAKGLILDALEMCDDSSLLELLGRVHALQHASGRAKGIVLPHTTVSIALARQEQGDDFSRDEVDDLDLVWEETSLSTQLEHDSECVKAAETVQAVISANIPRDADAIEWLVELGDESSVPFLDSRGSSPVISNENASAAAQLPSFPNDWQADGHAHSASFPKVITAKKRSKFYELEQQALAFIQANPACLVSDLAAGLELPKELANYLAATLQTEWIDKDRLGRLTIKQKSQLPSIDSFSVRDERDGIGAMPSVHEADIQVSTGSAGESPSDIAAKCAALPERSRQLLRFVIDNPGQKTHAVAQALGLSLAVVHNLLAAGLEEYLECTNFEVRARPEVANALKGSQLEKSHPATLQRQGSMTATAAHPPGREQPDDLDVSSNDIAKAERLSRLSPASKSLLGLLHTAIFKVVVA